MQSSFLGFSKFFLIVSLLLSLVQSVLAVSLQYDEIAIGLIGKTIATQLDADQNFERQGNIIKYNTGVTCFCYKFSDQSGMCECFKAEQHVNTYCIYQTSKHLLSVEPCRAKNFDQ